MCRYLNSLDKYSPELLPTDQEIKKMVRRHWHGRDKEGKLAFLYGLKKLIPIWSQAGYYELAEQMKRSFQYGLQNLGFVEEPDLQ
jgi:hypothetical protein